MRTSVRVADKAVINRVTGSVGGKPTLDAGANESIYTALNEFSVTKPIRRVSGHATSPYSCDGAVCPYVVLVGIYFK